MADARHDSEYLHDDSVESTSIAEKGHFGLGYKPVPPMSPPLERSALVEDDLDAAKEADVTLTEPLKKPWTPISLRRWFAISLISFMILVAASLEIALHFSNVQRGWRVPSAFSATFGILHYVYTLPPVAVAMVIVGLWAWTDVEIKKIQPYIDLAYGNAPASKSLLLDYASQHPAIVSVYAYRHSHYIVAMSSFMVLGGLAVQPLAASLFTVKDTWWTVPNINVSNFAIPGLDPNFGNLTSFAAAAGFVQSNVMFNASPPNFVTGVWAIAAVEVPTDQVSNGTMSVNTTSIQSKTHCKAGETSSITPFGNNTGFTLAGTSDGCSVSIPVQSSGTVQYGVDVVTCPQDPPPDPFKPVIFWTLSHPDPSVSPAYSLVYCTPTIELYNVMAQVALQTGALQNATILNTYVQPNSITDPNGFMKGRAMNGIAFDLSGADSLTVERAQATRNGLAAAVVQKAQQSPGGLVGQIESFGTIQITEKLYDLYLSLVARNNYFVPTQGSLEVQIKTFRPRLWMVDVTVHILAVVLLAFAAACAFVHVKHSQMRDLVIIPRRPGTIASAAAFTARSNVADVLDGNLDEASMNRVLRNKRFHIDKNTGRLVMQGHEGFEGAETLPVDRRGSILVRLRNLATSREK